MNIFAVSLIAFIVVASIFIVWRHRIDTYHDKTEGVDIAAGASDSELHGVVTITANVDYPGSRRYDGSPAIVRYDATDASGKARVSKWILARKNCYYQLRGHDVLYEYYREDGTLASDRLVHPEAGLGGGIYSKERRRFFECGADGEKQLVREVYYRADGTKGLVSEEKSLLFQHYRLDGKSLHSEYFSTVGVGQRSVYYRLDGKTVWMEKDEKDNARVYFDLDGNAVDLRFTRVDVAGSFSMGPDSEPILWSYDKYRRVGLDGLESPDYDQVWYARHDKEHQSLVPTLGAVIVYDTFGNAKIEYTLELLPANQPRFITQVVQHNADGSTLVRKYRAPGCRSIEMLLDDKVVEVSREEFDDNDVYHEDADEVIFQGFIRNVHGTYDDESHDI